MEIVALLRKNIDTATSKFYYWTGRNRRNLITCIGGRGYYTPHAIIDFAGVGGKFYLRPYCILYDKQWRKFSALTKSIYTQVVNPANGRLELLLLCEGRRGSTPPTVISTHAIARYSERSGKAMRGVLADRIMADIIDELSFSVCIFIEGIYGAKADDRQLMEFRVKSGAFLGFWDRTRDVYHCETFIDDELLLRSPGRAYCKADGEIAKRTTLEFDAVVLNKAKSRKALKDLLANMSGCGSIDEKGENLTKIHEDVFNGILSGQTLEADELAKAKERNRKRFVMKLKHRNSMGKL